MSEQVWGIFENVFRGFVVLFFAGLALGSAVEIFNRKLGEILASMLMIIIGVIALTGVYYLGLFAKGIL